MNFDNIAIYKPEKKKEKKELIGLAFLKRGHNNNSTWYQRLVTSFMAWKLNMTYVHVEAFDPGSGKSYSIIQGKRVHSDDKEYKRKGYDHYYVQTTKKKKRLFFKNLSKHVNDTEFDKIGFHLNFLFGCIKFDYTPDRVFCSSLIDMELKKAGIYENKTDSCKTLPDDIYAIFDDDERFIHLNNLADEFKYNLNVKSSKHQKDMKKMRINSYSDDDSDYYTV